MAIFLRSSRDYSQASQDGNSRAQNGPGRVVDDRADPRIQYGDILERSGKGGMRPIALDAHAQYAGAQLLKTRVVLTERFELGSSYTTEVEQIPGQHDGSTAKVFGQGDGLPSRRWQGKEWRPIAHPKCSRIRHC